LATSPLLARSQSQWSLVAHDGGDLFPLRSFPCQVGRHPGAAIRVVHPTVSLMHAEFRNQPQGLVIVDLSSRNGTFLNGNRVSQPQPLKDNDLVQFGGTVFRLQHQQPQSTQSPAANLCVTCQSEDVGDLALALAQFDKLIDDESVVPVYQPIVKAQTSEPIAYEALARSRLYGLDKPAMMFRAAEFLRMEAELSRMLRQAELSTSSSTQLPHLFLNTHPAELTDFKQLILSLREIRTMRPQQQLTLEVHEAAAVEPNTIKMLRLALSDLGMKLAFDDFGAGQARLSELVEARPDYVKFDRKLISGIDKSGTSRQQMVGSLVAMCRQLGIVTLAEGVETAGEVEVCRQIGFELMQGYFFGRPVASSPPASGPHNGVTAAAAR
jgi:EAL domain-containing protein (putative c-di-GMP-specific phosphodiesterase class I)